MIVQTCTKRMPAWVVQHPAGQWWNFSLVPPTIYTSLKLVSSAFFQNACKISPFSSTQAALLAHSLSLASQKLEKPPRGPRARE
jgi:hypothetical protein